MEIRNLSEIQTLDSSRQRKMLGGSNGISALIKVAQLKSQNANEEALHGADKKGDNVKAPVTRLSYRPVFGSWASFR